MLALQKLLPPGWKEQASDLVHSTRGGLKMDQVPARGSVQLEGPS